MKDDKRVFISACSNFEHVSLSRWSDNHGEFLLMFYPYQVGVAKGIACGLGNIQKLEDGERLGGGGVSAAADFAV